NTFAYHIPLANQQTISTSDLYFTGTTEGNTVSFKADAGEGKYFEQKYTLSPDNYTLDYQISAVGLQSVLKPSTKTLSLHWENYLSKYEKSEKFEQNYSTAYFKEADKGTNYCKCVSDDTKDIQNKSIEWVSHTNQYFNTSLISKDQPFSGALLATKMTDVEKSDILKIITSDISVPLNDGSHEMSLYIGPNEYKRLA